VGTPWFSCGLFGSTVATTTLSAPTALWVLAVPLDPTTLNYYYHCQGLRPGFEVVSVSLATSAPGVADVATPVSFTANESTGTTDVLPGASGTAVVSVLTPFGFSTPSNFQAVTVTVSAPDIFLPAPTVGRNLQVSATAALEAPAPAGGVTLSISAADPGVLLSLDPMTVGSGSIALDVPAGATVSAPFYVQALAGTGSVGVTATAPGFDGDTESVSLVPSGFFIEGVPSPVTTSTSDADTTLRIRPARLSPTTLNVDEVQSLRAGMADTQVFVTSDDTAAGTITISPVVFDGADVPNERVTSFHPEAPGTTVVRISSPGFSPASNGNDITFNVTSP
jgi:hypothetical protein